MLPGFRLTNTQTQPTTMQPTTHTYTFTFPNPEPESGPVASRTRAAQRSAAAARAQNAGDGVLVSKAWVAVAAERDWTADPIGVPPTLEEVRAAIPEQGIETAELIRVFYPRVWGHSACAFIAQIQELARQDPVTKMVFLKE